MLLACMLHAAGHTKPVHCCAWNGMLKVLASGSSDRRVLLWNPFSCRTLGTLEGHTAPVVCLASNQRDMQIISAAADNTVKVGWVLCWTFVMLSVSIEMGYECGLVCRCGKHGKHCWPDEVTDCTSYWGLLCPHNSTGCGL
jgi:WD40 repeat protein